MLLEFSLTNYRSFRDKQTLSLIGTVGESQLSNNLVKLDFPGARGVAVLRSAAIYGANASGKSNLFSAVNFVQSFVAESATSMKPKDEIEVVPFAFHPECKSQPSEFEVIFIAENVRYRYGFSATRRKVVREWLFGYPHGRERRLFERRLSGDDYFYEYGSRFKQERILESKTRSNALFLSLGAQFNNVELLSIYNWFHDSLRVLNMSGEGPVLSPGFTAETAQSSHEMRRAFVNLLRSADMGIEDMEVAISPVGKSELSQFSQSFLDLLTPEGRRELETKLQEGKIVDVKLIHRISESEVPVRFSLSEESAGTQRLFTLSGPLYDVLSSGMCLLIDEIDASMHPIMTREIVRLFHSDLDNQSGAQLLFTTHDTTLLDSTFLRRDQVWFVERGSDNSSRLVPLTDYKPRRREALQKGYMAGRYGGIPLVSDELSFFGE